ncbi:unnamed protein product [Callosobruchus maculatus]|uniref:Uncharacterized protein n=1 Tax=Callosobruchus maculatus TaxID=64391 RepID=A0A653BJW9_CALMS|nr:unnamed protein product [Callosobruchus maculatus]
MILIGYIRMCYHMLLQITGVNSFISALRTLVDFAATRCYKIRMSSNYVIIYF